MLRRRGLSDAHPNNAKQTETYAFPSVGFLEAPRKPVFEGFVVVVIIVKAVSWMALNPLGSQG